MSRRMIHARKEKPTISLKPLKTPYKSRIQEDTQGDILLVSSPEVQELRTPEIIISDSEESVLSRESEKKVLSVRKKFITPQKRCSAIIDLVSSSEDIISLLAESDEEDKELEKKVLAKYVDEPTLTVERLLDAQRNKTSSKSELEPIDIQEPSFDMFIIFRHVKVIKEKRRRKTLNFKIGANRDDSMKTVFKRFIETREAKEYEELTSITKLRFEFDGEIITPYDTVSGLDLDDEELIDVFTT
eukprot:snap_masked-scaffold_7-processed-gene-1.25-mRNA-1 protein AED:1.00 eAED:1.00 QI:0/-1/0/0/-1/1/1/0/243